ncbi:unnamed protein product [Effrenium voratum]|nr:unnamed protein product [Effrenium voratum]
MTRWWWLLLTPALAETEGIPSCAVTGKSYSHPTVTVLNGGRPMEASDCQRECELTAMCSFFTFYTDSRGCWLLPSGAKLEPRHEVASEAYAVSGPKICPPTTTTTTTTTTTETTTMETTTAELDTDEKGVMTVAPGIEIGPTGPRPAPGILGSMNETLMHIAGSFFDPNSTETVEVPYTEMSFPAKIYGIDWYWWLTGVAVIAVVGLCVMCSLCCPSKPRRKRAIQAEVMRASASAPPQEEQPLMKDAGLFRPRLEVPQLPMPQLVAPQLVSVPASQANARSFELHAYSPQGSPCHGSRPGWP